MNGEIMMKNIKLVEKEVLDEVSLSYFINYVVFTSSILLKSLGVV